MPLALGLDNHRDFGCQPGSDLDRDLVRAERLQWLFEIDLVAVDDDPTAAEGLRDLLGPDRAIELARVADLHAERQGRRADPRRGDLGLGPLLGALLLAGCDVVLICAER